MNPSLRKLRLTVMLCSAAAALPLQAANVFDSQALNSAIDERRDGEVYAAIDKLERMLDQVPQANRVKLELAVAYFQADIFDEAERLATEVQESDDIPDAVRANVDKFLALLAKTQQAASETASRFSYEMAFYAGKDDNVNHGLDNDIIDGGLATPVGFRDRDDNFLGVKATVNHRYRFAGSKRVGDRPAVLTWESQGYIYRKDHSGENEFNIDVISFGTGPVLRVTNGTTYRGKLRVDHIRQGQDVLGTFLSLIPEASFRLGNGVMRLDALLQRREYEQDASEGREGNRLGIGATYDIEVADQMKVSAGWFGYTQNADVRNQDHTSQGYTLGWQWRPYTPLRLYAQYRYKDSEYQGIEPLIGEARETDEDRWTVGAQYAVAKWLFGLQGQWTDVEANGLAFEYERKEIVATAARRFD